MLRGMCGLLCGWILVSGLSAQETNPANLPVATVDVFQVYKQHKPVAEKLELLKQTALELEKTSQIRQVEIETLQRKLQSPAKPGEDREKMQLQLVKLQTELRLFVERERGQLQKREITIQVETYKQIQEEVARIAKERKLKLVFVRPLRSLDSENLVEVGQALNQLILFEDGLDISQDILKSLEAKHKTSP